MSESNAPTASAIKSESTDSANVYGWPYRGPAWLAEMLALDVRSIALFRVLVGSISLWDVCHDYLPDAQWFLHDSGYSVSIVPVRGGRGLDAEIVLLGNLLLVRGNIDKMPADKACVDLRDIFAVLTCTRIRVLLLRLQIIQ